MDFRVIIGSAGSPIRLCPALFSLAMPHANPQPTTATATWQPLALGMFKEHSLPQLPQQMMLEFDLVMPQLWPLQCIVTAFHPPGICGNLFLAAEDFGQQLILESD